MNATAAETIAETTRNALDQLDQLPPQATVRGIIILLDVAHTDDDGDPATRIICQTSHGLGCAWEHGLLATAAHHALHGWTT